MSKKLNGIKGFVAVVLILTLLISLAPIVRAGVVKPSGIETKVGQPENAENFRFIVTGDNRPHGYGQPVKPFMKEIYKEVGLINPAFVINVGDVIHGYSTFFKDNKWDVEEQFLDYYSVANSIDVPVLLVTGNHDVVGKDASEVREELFGKSYYSFTYGNSHFVVLNSEVLEEGKTFNGDEGGFTAEEIDWFKNDMEEHKDTTHTFIFMHRPLYDLPEYPSHAPYEDHMDQRQAILDIINEYKPDIVFEGHQHLFNVSEHDGVTYIITGGAGAPFYAPPNENGFPHYLVINVNSEEVNYDVILSGLIKPIYDKPNDGRYSENSVTIYNYLPAQQLTIPFDGLHFIMPKADSYKISNVEYGVAEIKDTKDIGNNQIDVRVSFTFQPTKYNEYPWTKITLQAVDNVKYPEISDVDIKFSTNFGGWETTAKKFEKDEETYINNSALSLFSEFEDEFRRVKFTSNDTMLEMWLDTPYALLKDSTLLSTSEFPVSEFGGVFVPVKYAVEKVGGAYSEEDGTITISDIGMAKASGNLVVKSNIASRVFNLMYIVSRGDIKKGVKFGKSIALPVGKYTLSFPSIPSSLGLPGTEAEAPDNIEVEIKEGETRTIQADYKDVAPPEISKPIVMIKSNSFTITGAVSDFFSGVKSVKVNGQDAIIKAGTAFFATVPRTTEGKVDFNIVAEDNAGNKSEKTISVVCYKPRVLVLQIGKPYFTVNGKEEPLDTAPIVKDGRTILPIRAMVEALGGTVDWDATEKKVRINLKETTIELWIDNPKAKVNGVEKWIDDSNHDVKPLIINNRIMIPLMFVSENLGCSVDWDAATKTITIIYQG